MPGSNYCQYTHVITSFNLNSNSMTNKKKYCSHPILQMRNWGRKSAWEDHAHPPKGRAIVQKQSGSRAFVFLQLCSVHWTRGCLFQDKVISPMCSRTGLTDFYQGSPGDCALIFILLLLVVTMGCGGGKWGLE